MVRSNEVAREKLAVVLLGGKGDTMEKFVMTPNHTTPHQRAGTNSQGSPNNFGRQSKKDSHEATRVLAE